MTRVATSLLVSERYFETNSTNITDFPLKLEKLLAAAEKITDNPDLLKKTFGQPNSLKKDVGSKRIY